MTQQRCSRPRPLEPIARALGLFVVALSPILAGCATEARNDPASRPPLRVVTTTGMIADAAKAIGGGEVTVAALMGPGIDPHLYKASEGDVTRLSEAQLILYNGLHLEAKMGEVLEQMNRRTRAVAVAEAIPEARRLAPVGSQGIADPHVWFDVERWSIAVARVRDALIEVDPSHAADYRSRAEQYLASLAALHAEVLTTVAAIPASKRVLITAHDAFQYFGHAYGFEVRGLQGISTQSEAGTADVQELAEFIASRRIPAIFVESSVSPRAIEAVRAAVESRGFHVTIGGQLFSDAMGSEGTPEGTYVGMVRHNVRTIVSALASEVS
jgi:manganese/zinc/iron transport system substrate-binding protein